MSGMGDGRSTDRKEVPQDGRFYIKGSRIFKAPKATKIEGGKSISLGFPVCEVTEYIGAEGMAFIVEALNLHEAGHLGCHCPHCNPAPASGRTPNPLSNTTGGGE